MVLTLDAYLDESAHPSGSEPLCVAGFAFKRAAYRAFSRAWGRMLAMGPVPTTHFHATELYAKNSKDLYQGWSVEDRARVLQAAVDAVQQHTYCGVSTLFSQSEYIATAPPLWAQTRGSMYSAACQMALNALAFWMTEHRCYLPIAYAFEAGQEFWAEANALMTGAFTHPTLKKRYRYKSHTAVDKADAYGLQAADLLAWALVRRSVGWPVNHTMAAFRPILERFLDGTPDRYQHFHPSGDTLVQYFAEQVAAKDHVVVEFSGRKLHRVRLR